MDIKILGEGCDRCDKLYANTRQAMDELGIDTEIEKVESLLEIVKLGVMDAPTLMIDGKVALSGQVASTKKIKKILQKLL